MANALRPNPETYQAFVEAYLQDDPDRVAGFYAGMVLERLEHLAWNAHVVSSEGFSAPEVSHSAGKITELIAALQAITAEFAARIA